MNIFLKNNSLIFQVMRLFLQTYNEDSINAIIEPLNLAQQGIKNRNSIRTHLIMLEHLLIFKDLGINLKSKDYLKLEKLSDKSEKFLEMMSASSLDLRTAAKSFARLAFDFKITCFDVWAQIFLNYPISDELFQLARKLNVQPWFVENLRTSGKLRRNFVQLWNPLLAFVAKEPEWTVRGVYEFFIPFLLDIKQLVQVIA